MNYKIPASTTTGLVLAFFGAPLLIFIFNQFTEGMPLTNELVIFREIGLFLITGLLLVLVIKGEKLNLGTIGLHNKHWGKSLVLALPIARGTHPDAELSPKTVAGLQADGLTPNESHPRKLSRAEVELAHRIVVFCELPEEHRGNAMIEQWDDTPPVSQKYERP